MKIKLLTQQLEKEINKRMDLFMTHGKKAKELVQQTEQCYKDMHDILVELEPVEFIVRQQNPNMSELFDNLKRQYGTAEKIENKEEIDGK